MDRINHPSAEADKFGAGKDGFTDGTPADESSGTVVNEDFLDGVQEELVGIIEAAGDTPSNGDYTQLVQALLLKIGGTMTGQLLFDMDNQTARMRDTNTVAQNQARLIWQMGPMRLYYFRTYDILGHHYVYMTWNCWYNNGTEAWVDEGNGCVWSFNFSQPAGGGALTFYHGVSGGALSEGTTLHMGTQSFIETPGDKSNSLTHIPKVIANITVSSGVVSLAAGSVGLDGLPVISGNGLNCALDATFAGSAYMVPMVCNVAPSASHIYYAAPQGVSSVYVGGHTSAGTAMNPAVYDQFINLVVHGTKF